MNHSLKAVVTAVCALATFPAFAHTQSLDLTVDGVGISIGDSRRVTGLRINFRDRDMEKVVGVNATLWTPYNENFRGSVHGLAIGLPATGARQVDGIAAGIIGVGIGETIRGIGIGGIGLGVGEDVRGIALGGIGMGVGLDVRGAAIGGIGAGIGGSVRGVGIGGIGLGIGGDVNGVLIGGIGAGVGGDVEGVTIAGFGLGAGGSVKGLTLTAGGIGAGGNMTGLQIAGIGIGSGGTVKWVTLAGLGIGAPEIEGVAVAVGIGAQQARGLIVAPIYFKISKGGHMRGVNVSAYNDIRGRQQGLAIGIFNYARSLDGLQLGLLNYAGNKPRGTRLLPILNFARAR